LIRCCFSRFMCLFLSRLLFFGAPFSLLSALTGFLVYVYAAASTAAVVAVFVSLALAWLNGKYAAIAASKLSNVSSHLLCYSKSMPKTLITPAIEVNKSVISEVRHTRRRRKAKRWRNIGRRTGANDSRLFFHNPLFMLRCYNSSVFRTATWGFSLAWRALSARRFV